MNRLQTTYLKYKNRPKQSNVKWKDSIAWKLFIGIISCLLLLVAVNWLLNTFVLVKYYRHQKERDLLGVYERLNSSISDNAAVSMEDELYRLLESNVRITVWANHTLIYESPGGGGNEWLGKGPLPQVNLESGEYRIVSGKDPRSQSETIILIGRFNNGYNSMISTPVTAIEDSVDITNRFLLISGGLGLLIASLVVFFLTKRFTNPIRQLSHIANSVSRLDFSNRYAIQGKDELAALGSSINTMAQALETTISDLKTANLQLINDNERTMKQSEARRAFITNVSHELKTPISLIQTYAEGLKEDIANGAANRDFYCEVIEDEANKMSVLIKKMTILMQLEAGNEELVIERFDIHELTQNLMLKLQPKFEQKNLSVQYPLEQPVFVWADEFLIDNVLTNYLLNAINHVGENGEIRVTIKQKDNRVRIAVFNSGSHIDTEDLPHIWESFYKVDKARTRKYGGTGIGLSVVAAIMNAHHQPYGVGNTADGIEFYIELEAG